MKLCMPIKINSILTWIRYCIDKKLIIGTFYRIFSVLLLVLLIFTGCAKTPIEPIYQDPSFSPIDVQDITVLRIVDIRKDRSVKLKEDRIGIKNIPLLFEKRLKKKGYKVSLEGNISNFRNGSEEEILDSDPTWIRSLGPEDGRWILLTGLEDVVKRKTFGAAAAAECFGILFDKMSGKVVWRDRVVEEFGAGGLLGFGAQVEEGTVHLCFTELLRQFPSRISR